MFYRSTHVIVLSSGDCDSYESISVDANMLKGILNCRQVFKQFPKRQDLEFLVVGRLVISRRMVSGSVIGPRYVFFDHAFLTQLRRRGKEHISLCARRRKVLQT